ncbi:hypothetical protein LINGRAHAP2_LOCUS31139 [Linum grandiflorum]
MQNGCFLVRFREKEDYETAMTGGPWLLGDTYLTVHRWHKSFNPWNAEAKTTMVWIQLPDLPIKYYHPNAVMRIARKIGSPVRVDRATEEGARAKYARVCIDLDLTKALLPKYKIDGIKYLVVYEGLKDLCTSCGRYGAPTHSCQCQNPVTKTAAWDESTNIDTSEDPKEHDNAFGSWMIGKPNFRRRARTTQRGADATRPVTVLGNPVTNATQNRFSALQSDEKEDLSMPTNHSNQPNAFQDISTDSGGGRSAISVGVATGSHAHASPQRSSAQNKEGKRPVTAKSSADTIDWEQGDMR